MKCYLFQIYLISINCHIQYLVFEVYAVHTSKNNICILTLFDQKSTWIKNLYNPNKATPKRRYKPIKKCLTQLVCITQIPSSSHPSSKHNPSKTLKVINGCLESYEERDNYGFHLNADKRTNQNGLEVLELEQCVLPILKFMHICSVSQHPPLSILMQKFCEDSIVGFVKYDLFTRGALRYGIGV